MVPGRVLTKKEIEGLIADVFKVSAQDIEFEVGGKYSLELSFSVHDEYLTIDKSGLYKIK